MCAVTHFYHIHLYHIIVYVLSRLHCMYDMLQRLGVLSLKECFVTVKSSAISVTSVVRGFLSMQDSCHITEPVTICSSTCVTCVVRRSTMCSLCELIAGPSIMERSPSPVECVATPSATSAI